MMFGEGYDAQDAGHVPENPEFPQNHSDEQDEVNVIDESKWPGWPGFNIFRMLIPLHKVDRIGGYNGVTKAHIQIFKAPPVTNETVVLVSAKEEPNDPIPPAVEGLLRVHKQLNVDHNPPYSSAASNHVFTRLLVPDAQAKRLIWKENSIANKTRCIIQAISAEYLPVFALPDDTVFEIQGQLADVHKAVELIALHLRIFLADRSIITVFEKWMRRLDARFNKNLPPPQYMSPSNKVTKHIQIPLNCVNALIGKAAINITNMRVISEASITLQETDTSGQMTMEIRGTPSQVQVAQQLVQVSDFEGIVDS